MVLLLFYGGSVVQIEGCTDVIHRPGHLVCVDALGASLATFEDGEIVGYTLDPSAILKLNVGTVPVLIRGRMRLCSLGCPHMAELPVLVLGNLLVKGNSSATYLRVALGQLLRAHSGSDATRWVGLVAEGLKGGQVWM